MKLLYPCAYYYPETCAGIYIIDNIVEAASKSGIDCLLTVPSPSRDVQDGVGWQRVEKKYGDKCTIRRFRMYGEGRNPISRAIRYVLCEVVQLYFCLFKKYDVLLIYSAPPIQGLKLPLVKLLRRKPIVYNVQDIFPDTLVCAGLAKEGSLMWRIGTIIMKITYACCDKFVVISNDFKTNMVAKGVPAEKIEVINNWAEQDVVVDIPRDKNRLFDKYSFDRAKFYVTYCGNIGMTQNLDLLLDVAAEFQNKYYEIIFVLVGNGAYRDDLARKITERELKNVHLLPFQPYEDISHVFSLGDASLVISKPGTGAASVPSKTWSIMSASRPVLANFDENELKDIVEKNRCGIFTKAGDKEAFKESILKLYNNRELCEEYGKNGRQFVMDNLTKEVGTQKYVDVIKSVVK